MHPSAAGCPAFLVFLPGTGHGQGIRRHVLGDGGAGRDISALAHRNRRNQIAVAAYEGSVAYGRALSIGSVVVYEYYAAS